MKALDPGATIPNRLARYAWSITVGAVAVILWGAVVRATGSGAGCGSHWPDCDGLANPLTGSPELFIEFVHRFTSGMLLIGVAVLFFWVRRTHPVEHRVRVAATWAARFAVIEALIGAAIVIFGWTDDDTSVGRVVSIGFHLANTFLLLGSLSLTAWWAGGGPPVRLRESGAAGRALIGGFALLTVAAGVGAVTALGDTLYPAESLISGLRRDVSTQAEILERLRIVHPALAVAASLYVLSLVRRFGGSPPASRLGAVVAALVGVQVVAGVVNLVLLAPLAMQLLHLFLADALVIAFVLFVAVALGEDQETQRARPAAIEAIG